MAHSNPFLVDQSLAGDRQVDGLFVNPNTYDKLKKEMVNIIIKLGVRDEGWKPPKNTITDEGLMLEIQNKITFLKAEKSKELTINASLTRQIQTLHTRDAQLSKDIERVQNENLTLSERVTELTNQEQLLSTEIKGLKSDKDNLTKTIDVLTGKARTNEQKKTELEVNILSLKSKLSETAKEVKEANHELGLRALTISKMETQIKQLSAQNKKLEESIQRLRVPHHVPVYENPGQHEQEHGQGSGSSYTTINPNTVVNNSKKKMKE